LAAAEGDRERGMEGLLAEPSPPPPPRLASDRGALTAAGVEASGGGVWR